MVAIAADECYTVDVASQTITNYTVGGPYNCPVNPKISSVINGVTILNIGLGSFISLPIVAVEIPSSVLVIDVNAFMYTSLSYVKLNEGLVTIKDNAFLSSHIESLVIPNSVENIF